MSESLKILNKVAPFLGNFVMDLGCGDTKIVESAYGIDGRDLPCINYQSDSLYGLPHKLIELTGKFDSVFSSHVLEHLPDAYTAVLEWSTFLKKGGFFILYLPDGRYYNNKENLEHFHDFTHDGFMFWFRRAFCGEALNYKGEQYNAPLFRVVEDGLDVGENRYSFYLIAEKT